MAAGRISNFNSFRVPVKKESTTVLCLQLAWYLLAANSVERSRPLRLGGAVD